MKKNEGKLYCSLALLGLMLFFISGCKKESNPVPVDLMTGATEYTGTYPDPAEVTYLNQGVSTVVIAYPGQVIAFFNLPSNETDATELITDKGGTVLAKVPSAGFYLISTSPSQASSLINSLQGNSLVKAATPHIAGYLRGSVSMLDYCGQDHASGVLQVLQACGGTFDECTKISEDGKYVATGKLIHAITNEVNKNKGGTTLINLSANGGLENNTNWQTQPLSKQQLALDAWYWFMYAVLNTVAALPAEYRANLVITIASGNEKMPIDDILVLLRQRSGFAEILKRNILIVSTERNSGFGNYAVDDPDVVVMNNTSAQSGTSLAAPCAMGFIDSIMRAKAINAGKALEAMKMASMLKPNREILFGNALAMVGVKAYVSGPCNLVGHLIWSYDGNSNCTGTLSFAIQSITLLWDGTNGNISIPATANFTLTSGICPPAENNGTDSKIMNGTITGSNSNVNGSAIATFVFPTTHPLLSLSLSFTGSISGNGDLTGTISCPMFSETIPVLLKKQ